MWNVFKLQWKRLFKQPFLVLLFLGITVAFVYVMGGVEGTQTIDIQTYSEELSTEELSDWIDRLNEDETYHFEATDYETVYEDIRMNATPFALEIEADTYRFLVGREDAEISPIIQYVDQFFAREQRISEVEGAYLDEPLEEVDFIELETTSRTELGSSAQESNIGVLIGMTLYFTVYTILFLMLNILEEKRMGTWNRLIFSPVTKVKIYTGQLLHYFLVGLFQIILAFLILSYLININLGQNYIPMLIIASCFVFSIVALGMLIMGIVKTPQQLQVIIPIVATAMAMIGGAFWPIEIVSNDVLLFLAELMPIKYGIDGLSGAIIQGQSLSQLGEPIAVLLLMGVIFMGIGLNLMERVAE